MTVAEMTEAKFLKRQSRTAVSGECERSQEAVLESSFFRTKKIVDRLVAIVLLVPALPIIALLIVAIRLTSRGPGVFKQTRVGEGGRIFTMYKLRSMRLDAEASTGPAWSSVGIDPRVTKLGYWLRRLHLDELPQLLNVVRGEMSLVGPRPERPEFVHVLADQVPGYLNRLIVQPGITGLAQINLPPDTDLDSVRRKLVVDLDYIETAGVWLDLRILACTALRMVWIKGPAVTKAIGLERTVYLSVLSANVDQLQPVSVNELVGQGSKRPARRAAAGQV